jgi:hypothetical protein
MAEADKDGRMAQVVGDLHTTASMALAEHALEAAADFDREMAKVQAVIDGGGSNLAALRLALAAMSRPCIADQDPGLWGDQA